MTSPHLIGNPKWIAAIRTAAHLPPTLPVLVRKAARYSGGLPWLAPWPATDPVPPTDGGKEPLMLISIRRISTSDSVKGSLAAVARRWDAAKPPVVGGFVIDTRAKPTDEALSLLAPLATVPE